MQKKKFQLMNNIQIFTVYQEGNNIEIINLVESTRVNLTGG